MAEDEKVRSDTSRASVTDAADAASAEPMPETSRYRRLHTASGAVALGAFLSGHILTNASALGGANSYDAVVGVIGRSRLLPLFELVFILIPLGFHAGYGLLLLRRGRTASSSIERFEGHRRWVFQRVSAIFLLLFVLVHVWELRLQRLLFGLSTDGLYTLLTAHLSWTWAGVPWIALFYLLGTLAAAAHFTNGLFAATGAWNISVRSAGQKRIRLATAGLGLVLFLIGSATVIGIATGTRLLPGADDDSAATSAPCGSAFTEPSSPLELPSPSP